MRVLTDKELESLYNEMLDEFYDTTNICGLSYTPSMALKAVDRVAYNVGLSDYISSLLEDGQYIENEDGDICEVGNND